MKDNLRAMALLTGIERERLETDPRCHPDPVQDGAPELVTDEDGMIYLTPAPLKDQLMYLIAKWIWDEAVGDATV